MMAQIKKFKYDAPKVRFLGPNKVFWAQKKFCWAPPQNKKIYFLKKPQFCNLTEHWRWFPQWPWSTGYHQTPVYNSKINYLAVAQCVMLRTTTGEVKLGYDRKLLHVVANFSVCLVLS